MNTSLWAVIGLGAALVAAGCGDDGDDSSPADAQSEDDAGAALCSAEIDLAAEGAADGQLSGDWAAFTRYRVLAGSNGAQIARSWSIYGIAQEGDGSLTVTETLCAQEVDSEDGSIDVRVRPSFVTGLDPDVRPGALTPDGDGFAFTLADHYSTRGITLDDIAGDPLPEDPNDPRIGDWDEDNNPGMTLLLSGILTGELFIIQRDQSRFAGQQVSAVRIEGQVVWSTEQITLGSDPEGIDVLLVDTLPDIDPTQHTFQLVRLDEGAGCAEVVERRCELFVDDGAGQDD